MLAWSRRSAIRAAVVWDAVQAVLAVWSDAASRTRPLQVVDLGGGTGGLAVRIAELGHQVVVVDPSPDALASLERRSRRRLTVQRAGQRDPSAVSSATPPPCPTSSRQESADVVVCHGVLEVVDVPAQALWTPLPPWPPAGRLSVLAAQRSAAVFARAVAGHVADARAVLADPDGRWGASDPMPRRFTRDQLVGAARAGRVHRRRDPRRPGVHRPPQQHRRRVRARGRRSLAGARGRGRPRIPTSCAIATQLHLLATPARPPESAMSRD